MALRKSNLSMEDGDHSYSPESGSSRQYTFDPESATPNNKVFVDPKTSVRPDGMFVFELEAHSIPYHEQGDETWNTEKKMKKRRALLEHVRLAKCTHRWWKTFRKVPVPSRKDERKKMEAEQESQQGEREDGTVETPERNEMCILREDYINVYLKMAKALYKHTFNEGICRGHALMDWKKDTGGGPSSFDDDDPESDHESEDEDDALYMTNEQLHSSLFELADMWTDTVKVTDYVDFLDKLYMRITDAHPTSRTPRTDREGDDGDADKDADEDEEEEEEAKLKTADELLAELDGECNSDGDGTTTRSKSQGAVNDDELEGERTFKDLKDVTAFEDGEIGSSHPSSRKENENDSLDDLSDDDEEDDEEKQDLPYDIVLTLKKAPLVTEVGEVGSEDRKTFEKTFLQDIAEALECSLERIKLRKIWIGQMDEGNSDDGEWGKKRHKVRIRIMPSVDPDSDERTASELAKELLRLWNRQDSELYDGLCGCGIDSKQKPVIRRCSDGDESNDDDDDELDNKNNELVQGNSFVKLQGHHAMQAAERHAQELLRPKAHSRKGRKANPNDRGPKIPDTVPEDGGATRPASRRKKRQPTQQPSLTDWAPKKVAPRVPVQTNGQGINDVMEKMLALRDPEKLKQMELKDLLFNISYAFGQTRDNKDRNVLINEACAKATWMTRHYPITRKIPAKRPKNNDILERKREIKQAKPQWADYCVQAINYMFKKKQISSDQRDVLIRITNPHLLKNENERRARKVLMTLLRQFAIQEGLLSSEDDPSAMEKNMEEEIQRQAERTLAKLAHQVSSVIDTKDKTLTPELKAKFDQMFAPSPPSQAKPEAVIQTSNRPRRAPLLHISGEARSQLQCSLGRRGAFWPGRAPREGFKHGGRVKPETKTHVNKRCDEEATGRKTMGLSASSNQLPPLSRKNTRASLPPTLKVSIKRSSKFKGAKSRKEVSREQNHHQVGKQERRGSSAPVHRSHWRGDGDRSVGKMRLKVPKDTFHGASLESDRTHASSVAAAPWKIFDNEEDERDLSNLSSALGNGKGNSFQSAQDIGGASAFPSQNPITGVFFMPKHPQKSAGSALPPIGTKARQRH
eukprot:CAMPEP_0184486612 /NCGR_PEP_ID=MMETSP0113_2-20130426/8085_1 /TAXON_ID=91329 /ORGANISM="Norrisiella sphaerica, Strain BC52" /LENGTH=1088 /DNA_ID=CAMNT_0026868571 /DNA_START=17 /DNA_END=3283 /DNA_ORIENTATION=+